MTDSKINGQLSGTISGVESINKLKKGREKDSEVAASQDHKSEIFFKMGEDNFIASGTMNVKDVKPGSEVTIDGKKGTVTSVGDDSHDALKRELAIAGGSLAVGVLAVATMPVAAAVIVGGGVVSLGAAAVGISHFRAEGFAKERGWANETEPNPKYDVESAVSPMTAEQAEEYKKTGGGVAPGAID